MQDTYEEIVHIMKLHYKFINVPQFDYKVALPTDISYDDMHHNRPQLFKLHLSRVTNWYFN